MPNEPADEGPEFALERATCHCARMQRRTVLYGIAATAGLGAMPAFAQAPGELPPQPGDFLVPTAGNVPLKPGDIRLNASPFGAFAMSPEGVVRSEDFINSIFLLRYEPDALPEASRAMAADGVVGFSMICTHAGCPLSDRLDNGLIACDCHGSRFNPIEGGQVANGPARRKLPQLTLEVKDGNLVVVAGLDGRIGGDAVGEDDR